MKVRTWLYAPGDHPHRCLKALASDADQVIWDLEDAVNPDAKALARTEISALLKGPLRRVPWVRINGIDTPWGRDDLEGLEKSFGPHQPCWVVPKATGRTVEQLSSWTSRGRWLLIIETAEGLSDVIHARNPWHLPGEARLAFGAIDYRNDIGAQETDDESEIAVPRSLLALISRSWNWPAPIDAVTPAIDNLDRVHSSARRGCALGMDGKMIIHPCQIGPVHQAYRPTPSDIEWAQEVIALSKQGGAVKVHGAMVDQPVVDRARRILRDAEEQ